MAELTDQQKIEIQAKRITDLELALKMMKQANVNLLNVIKEYARAVIDIWTKVMGEKEAEGAVTDLKIRHFGKG